MKLVVELSNKHECIESLVIILTIHTRSKKDMHESIYLGNSMF